MNESQTVNDNNDRLPQFSNQISRIEEFKEKTRLEVPHQLQGTIFERIENLSSDGSNQIEEQSIEVLINQAIKLKKLLEQFEHHLSQAAQSKAIAETEIELFWTKFDIGMLDPNEFQNKIKKYLDERYAKHAKETEVINDTNKKALKVSEETEAEIKEYLEYYFTTAEREKLYAQRARAEKKGLQALEDFQAKLVQLRKRKEVFTEYTLNIVAQNKHRPLFCQKQFARLEKKCGAKIFSLPSVESVRKELERPTELYEEFERLKAEASNLNEEFRDITGKNLPGFKFQTPTKADNDNTLEEENDKDQEIKEKVESKETQIRALTETRRLLTHSMSFWSKADPKLLEDPSFSIAGGNRRKRIMSANENLPSVERYETEEMKSAQLAQAKDGTEGLWHYRTIDIPTYAEDFTPDKANTLISKLGTYTEGGGDDMVAMTGLWYIDMAKRGGAKAKSVSMNDYLSHIDHLLRELRGTDAQKIDLAA